jgi:hypothetical protein
MFFPQACELHGWTVQFQHGVDCAQNMKQEMAFHRYKIQITRLTHEAYIVIKREFTRYKMGGIFKYLYI